MNIDKDTVESFGDEWTRFDQSMMTEFEARRLFECYFRIFPWGELPSGSEGFDMGCGSGRWAHFVASRVGFLNCVDPSNAIDIAKKNLLIHKNIAFFRAAAGESFLPRASQDFGYSLGVLHHVPDFAAALRSCVDLLKPGAPFLLYVYYSLDSRPGWYRFLWFCSNLFRRFISGLPGGVKRLVTDILAVCIYLPLARLSLGLERLGFNVENIPLSFYRRSSFYVMRTDSRDRFGTPLESRFSREELQRLMIEAGLTNIRFSDSPPFWCAVGNRSF